MPALKVCATQGCPTLIPRGTTHCPTHAREYEARRGTRQQRGYGRDHDRLRAQWAARLTSSPTPIPCARCGHPIDPRTPWDLGHNDDRTQWTGPEHASCNRAAGGRAAH